MHGDRGRTEALERAQGERALDPRTDREVDVVDAELDQVVEVALAEIGSPRRSPGRGEDVQSVLESCYDLPGAVLAAADRHDAVIRTS